jgi:hypothetical protein
MTEPVAPEVTLNMSDVSPANKLDAVASSARGSIEQADLGMIAVRPPSPTRSSTWTRSRR